jgi:hypothetical protein
VNMVVANGIVCHVLWALSVKARAIDFDNGLDLNTYININHIYISVLFIYTYIYNLSVSTCIYKYIPIYIYIHFFLDVKNEQNQICFF